jgi:internalin A
MTENSYLSPRKNILWMSELARRLISKAKAENQTRLDMGNCSLSGNLPDELFAPYFVENLEWLSLGDRLWDVEKQQYIFTLNRGAENYFVGNEPDLIRLGELKALRYLYVSYYVRKGRLSSGIFLENCQSLVALGLWGNQISDLQSIPALPNLEDLRVSYNPIEHLIGLPEMPKLRILDIGQNQIEDIKALAAFPCLEKLWVNYNQIKDISPLQKLRNLQELDLGSNPIKDNELSPLEDLQHLHTLCYSSNKVNDLNIFRGLCGLKVLDLGGNQIENLYPLAKLKQLQKLNLNDNQINCIEPLSQLSDLQILNLDYNQVKDISPLAKLARLNELHLSDNLVEDIAALTELPQLRSLNLCNNQNVNFDLFLEDFDCLRNLNLNNTQNYDYSFLQNLTGLTKLELNFNQINDIQFLERLTSLEELDLSENNISDIDILENLRELKTLHLYYNRISHLKPLARLHKLTHLDIFHNEVSDLKPIRNLIHLKILNLGYNKIIDIYALYLLSELQSLSLTNNNIQQFPLEFLNVYTNLTQLYLKDNPISYIPKEIYEQENCARDLQAYWQELENGRSLVNQQLKVMFLGNGCVGKTTLLHWFLDGKYREISLEEGRTHGIIIQPYPFPGSEVLAHFWDFGGQEVYHATHRLFLGRRTLYLLVWASESPDKKAALHHPPQYWLDMIADVAGPHERSQVLIVQNRFEGQPERNILSDAEREGYEARGLDIETFSIDAKGGKGVRTLLSAIQEAAEGLVEEYREELPQSWVGIRTAVAKSREAGDKTLLMDDFRAICQDCQLGISPDIVLVYLHRAGEVFHYPGRFGDQIILDQQWALKAVYAVLKRERINLYQGRFRISDLIGFWQADDPGLSAADAKIFLWFMLDNQTAFYVEKSGDSGDPELVIPQLLTETKPVTLKPWAHIPDKTIHRIQYSFLHRDIIERFIAHTAYLSKNKQYWRNGLYITYNNADAVVEVVETEGRRFLQIECVGPQATELLQRIRETLNEICSLDKAQESHFINGEWQAFREVVRLHRNMNAGFRLILVIGKKEAQQIGRFNGGLKDKSKEAKYTELEALIKRASEVLKVEKDKGESLAAISSLEKEGMTDQLKTKIRKLNRLLQAIAREADASVKFKYEEEIRDLRKEIDDLKEEIARYAEG